MRFLITGAAGFLGSALANRLVREDNTVRGIDDLSTGDPANLLPDVHLMDVGLEGLYYFTGLIYAEQYRVAIEDKIGDEVVAIPRQSGVTVRRAAERVAGRCPIRVIGKYISGFVPDPEEFPVPGQAERSGMYNCRIDKVLKGSIISQKEIFLHVNHI